VCPNRPTVEHKQFSVQKHYRPSIMGTSTKLRNVEPVSIVMGNRSGYTVSDFVLVVLVVQRFGVGLVIERSLVRLPVRALSSQLGQLSLPSLRGR